MYFVAEYRILIKTGYQTCHIVVNSANAELLIAFAEFWRYT